MRRFITNIVAKNWHFFLLFIMAIFLRFYKIEEFITFLGDQGRDALIIKRIVDFEHFPAIGAPSSVGQIFLGPFYYYLMALFLPLFNYNPVGLAIGVACYSLFFMLIIFLLIKKELDFLSALILIFFMTFSFTLIDFSRYSWNPNLVPYFSFLTLFFFYKSLQTRKKFFSFLFGCFLAFSIQLHYLALALFLPIIIFYIIRLHQAKTSKYYLNVFISALTGFILISSPLIIFDLKHQFINSKNFFNIFTGDKLVGKTPFIERLLDTNAAFYQHILQLPINQLLGVVITLVYLAIWIWLTKIKRKNIPFLIIVNITNFFLYIFTFSLLNSFRYPHYYGVIYLSFFLTVAYLLTIIQPKKVQKFLALAVLLFFLSVNVPHYYFLVKEGSRQIARAKRFADSFNGKIDSSKFQIVALPSTETDGHVRYFLELNGHRPLPYESSQQPDELFVLCYASCSPDNDGQWQIAAFIDKKIIKEWQVENVTIYKVIHKKK
ncbi:hypothetical protein A3F03_04835 [Candidatus Roizmanbacteria bacterium RIFCSPHIGHO2_12_FULL_41_11]|uniref:Glycosyltransferase RgtA/B/C/D-like domain-containing protein n=1 Tax=Candidatus Roizmanbacteria bacterium RIFCSPHIGHO2_12_FULL_41_11 TaxID=1802052 RepID=A0A1F7I384_9BACT|nr:MAG: hypothetical protein A3F03_04835 [Candidatus Roizmanbacteria bacterium RIFCSPHIGHO2_12_FULL_41_11]